MTNEQKQKLEKFDDQMLLCELAVAFGNTPEVDLTNYHRGLLMAIFENLNLEHFDDLP